MNKKEELEKIAEEIARCNICQGNSVGKSVPGEGSVNAKVLFVGEAPGKMEAQTGRPFIGRSGYNFLGNTFNLLVFQMRMYTLLVFVHTYLLSVRLHKSK